MSAPGKSRRDNPWYVEVFLAIGGWIAGLLAAGAIAAFVGVLFKDFANPRGAASTALGIGLAFVLAGSWFGRSGAGDFRRHFSIAMIAAGLTAATLAAWYLIWSFLDGDGKGFLGGDGRQIGRAGLATAALFIPVAALAARSVKDGILTFLTSSAWFWIVAISLLVLGERPDATALPFRIFPPVAALAGVLIFTAGPRSLRAVGAALLVSPMIFFETTRNAYGLLGGAQYEASPIAAYACAAGAVWCLTLLRDRYSLWSLLAATALLSAGIWFLPDAGGVALLILLAGMAAGHRGMAAVGVVALAWFIGKFYYDLSMTLLEKSAILAALGGATLIGALLSRRLQRGAATAGGPGGGRRPIAAALAFGALLAGSLVLVNRSVAALEEDFKDARSIYLPLGPVDPRSILQGDYMTLFFRETLYPSFEEIEALPERGEAFLKLDADGVASFSRIAGAADAPGPDEIRVDYVKRLGRLSYCPDSWFFQEGEAEFFAPARFAVLKVAADGKTRLVALADENRKIIEPPRR